jgi:senataxin
MSESEPSEEEIKVILKELHDFPTTEHSPEIIGKVFTYVIQRSPITPTPGIHWFCSEAEKTVADAACFLLILTAFNSDNVETWKEAMQMCLANCMNCVIGLEKAKAKFRTT